jgi:hypothetical protein
MLTWFVPDWGSLGYRPGRDRATWGTPGLVPLDHFIRLDDHGGEVLAGREVDAAVTAAVVFTGGYLSRLLRTVWTSHRGVLIVDGLKYLKAVPVGFFIEMGE